ncbi:MAG: hypothetical protein H6830_05555 [Planctomycetes bacterium]|nr:hypothetical protein [Planctomycetota bacterium]MCB9908987.1 hypothetical protein [Planctomycetota bacterium]MCB9911766.1 hypothetical protein [Planctomycetota bacterium]
MLVLWDSDHILKAYFDPKTSTLDLVSSFLAEGGRAAAFDGALSLGVDEDGLFHHLSLNINPADQPLGMPERPEDCPVATQAEVEVVEGGSAKVAYSPTGGMLCLAFDGIEAKEWARLGPNLVWLALDDEGQLAAIVVEGISRDPGGKAQAAWLAEMGFEE